MQVALAFYQKHNFFALVFLYFNHYLPTKKLGGSAL